MLKTPLGPTFLACVLGLCLTSAASAQPLRIKSAYTFPMQACPNYKNEPPWAEVGKVVRVVIRKGYDPIIPKRKVKHKDPEAKASDEDAGDISEPGYENKWDSYNNINQRPFHVNLRQFSPVVGKYVQIRVVLKADDNYRFYGDGTNPDEVDIRGVGAGDSQKRLCGAHFLARPAGRPPVVAFYTLMKAVSGQYEDIPYNIGLVPLLDPDTPFFIDPMIKNNG